SYVPGELVKGTVTKITNFGVFVQLEGDLEGLLHVSELADHKVEHPEDVVKVGEAIEVKILRVDTDERKIGLSLKRAQWAAEDAEQEQSPAQGGTAKRERAKLGGIQDSDGGVDGIVSDVLFSMPKPSEPAKDDEEQ
ncbi:MAG TPA: S1 RNA-binding domain-containing protein, partial [Phycisphaerae bacterium]|nr:S1 RNA-binding domain-containing protein [Phycisphaerae bacterium]